MNTDYCFYGGEDADEFPDFYDIKEGEIFLNLLAEDSPFFSLKLRYKGEALEERSLKVYGT